ncbi:WD40/YVTN/BNR-like repeat-containing protein [Roseiconus nitratireducens]|uniref:WD40/YVTN/BNR-like repeat-containing protein n=1 Tax=Roseiconus nitratireducens TaxID=2605748 RepID=UPI00137567D8|nr:YCF48-related protein [Roseiconus nitratireducens]
MSQTSGRTWDDRTPDRAQVTDYRSVVMLEGGTIVIASAGTPALILRSEDLGRSWLTTYRNEHDSAFIDSVRFWNQSHGFAFGDPMGGKFLLLKTVDGGRSWQDVPCPIAPLAGEAGFAASNGSIALSGTSSILIGLGGREDGGPSRVLSSEDGGNRWEVSEIACMPAGASSGVFAFGRRDAGFAVAVGGDYKQTENGDGNMAVSDDGGQTWRLPTGRRPDGFRSSVIFVPAEDAEGQGQGYWLATGPSGTEISDDGEDWRSVSETGFHALHRLSGQTVLAVGSDGRMAVLTGAAKVRP